MTTVYNFVWVCPLPPSTHDMAAAAYESNTYVLHPEVDAIILFPSLMSPCVFQPLAGPWIELLIASGESTITAEQVNLHLKVYAGMGATKLMHREPLFAGTGGRIEIERARNENGILRTHQGFAGSLHPIIQKRLNDAGRNKYFRIRVHHDALRSARDAKIPLTPFVNATSSEEPGSTADEQLVTALKRLHKYRKYRELEGKGCYELKVVGDTVQLWKNARGEQATDWNKPLQAYHPVYVLDKDAPDYLNFGHLTDIHVNGRLDILQRNPVSVIPGPSGPIAASPSISGLIEPTNRSLTRLMKAMATNATAHALFIGGDLIDHQLNAYHFDEIKAEMQAVWKAVDLKDQANHYAPGVDMLTFYSLVLDFCRSSNKPVFGVSGNHDTYLEPFGISPRAFGTKRANEGIPADVNLTFYEAGLAFGPTWADCDVSLWPDGTPRSSFKKAWMEWFYSVFTPFENFSVQLPAQQVVCLGWGDDEDMIAGGQGFGHLPRADKPITANQWTLVSEAERKASERRVILLTHFTVASFNDDIPLFRKPNAAAKSVARTFGTIEQAENEYCMGTFETQRARMLDLLGQRNITCVMSGHSHRRGLYFMGGPRDDDHDGLIERGKRTVTIHDPIGFKLSDVPEEQRAPAIVVSDCGGPYPRYNRYGEFGGWGSNVPSGSVVSFDEQGAFKAVDVVRAPSALPPRLAVAVDYFDVLKDGAWFPYLGTGLIDVAKEEEMLSNKGVPKGASFYTLLLGLHPSLIQAKLQVSSLSLYRAKSAQPPIILEPPAGQSKVALLGETNYLFHQWLNQGNDADRFASVVFTVKSTELAAQYNVSSPWNFEVQVTQTDDESGTFRAYYLRRPLRRTGGVTPYPEVPDFDWRKQHA